MRSLLVLIASAFTATWAHGEPPFASELFEGREDMGSSKGGFTCTASNLRKALNKANYEFNGNCETACSSCTGGEGRRLDSDSDTDWDAINNGPCADYPLPILCSASVYTSSDPINFVMEYREEVLCCWQLGAQPEAFLFDIPIDRRRSLADSPDVKKAEKPAYAMVKADFSESMVPKRSLKAASLEKHKLQPADLAVLKHGVPKTPELVASMRALAASLKGEEVERRLDEDSSMDSDEMTEDSDSSMDYDCNNYWQVRSDLLTAFDQSPWRTHSYCGAGREVFSMFFPIYIEQDGEETQCRDMPVFEDSIGSMDSLCRGGIFNRRDITWAISYLSYGPMQCCVKYGIFFE